MAPGRLVAGGCDQAPYNRESLKHSPSSSSDTLKFCIKSRPRGLAGVRRDALPVAPAVGTVCSLRRWLSRWLKSRRSGPGHTVHPFQAGPSLRLLRSKRMRSSPSIVPLDRLDREVYLVLEDFGARAAPGGRLTSGTLTSRRSSAICCLANTPTRSASWP